MTMKPAKLNNDVSEHGPVKTQSCRQLEYQLVKLTNLYKIENNIGE